MTTASNDRSHTRVELARSGIVATMRFVSDGPVNILSSSTLGELGKHVEHLAEDPHVRFVVFRGVGKTFIAGADIAEMSRFDETRGESYSRHGHTVFDAIEALPHVTIAAINGHALGGGCELALACDFRLMARGGKIGQPESRLGLIPGWGGTVRLPRLIGPAKARKLMFGGEAISADDALALGVVDEVAPGVEELDAAVSKWVEQLRPGSPAAIHRIKRAMGASDEKTQFSLCFSCSDAREGIKAFLEKRAPNWTQ
ncbi:MAG: enoyl-CoA hydratase/isomerase family protein [Phycisphaerales bacterium]|nr:enoyl-CoA hydratase/isomerase family protein [Phycisphaerales bacterium]